MSLILHDSAVMQVQKGKRWCTNNFTRRFYNAISLLPSYDDSYELHKTVLLSRQIFTTRVKSVGEEKVCNIKKAVVSIRQWSNFVVHKRKFLMKTWALSGPAFQSTRSGLTLRTMTREYTAIAKQCNRVSPPLSL